MYKNIEIKMENCTATHVKSKLEFAFNSIKSNEPVLITLKFKNNITSRNKQTLDKMIEEYPRLFFYSHDKLYCVQVEGYQNTPMSNNLSEFENRAKRFEKFSVDGYSQLTGFVEGEMGGVELEINRQHIKYSMHLDTLLRDTLSYRHYIYENINQEARADLNYDVDFQRGYVWSLQQKQELILSWLKELPIGTFYINKINPYSQGEGNIEKLQELDGVLFDGKQRLTTITSFLKMEFPVVYQGKELYAKDFSKNAINRALSCNVNVCETSFDNKLELVQYYLDINTSGTAHSRSDIEKVKEIVNIQV